MLCLLFILVLDRVPAMRLFKSALPETRPSNSRLGSGLFIHSLLSLLLWNDPDQIHPLGSERRGGDARCEDSEGMHAGMIL